MGIKDYLNIQNIMGIEKHALVWSEFLLESIPTVLYCISVNISQYNNQL